MLERLLQWMDRRIRQPSRFCVGPPLGEQLAQTRIAQRLLAALVTLFLQRQRLVVDEPARTREAAHLPFLLAVGPKFVLEGLTSFHGSIIRGVYER